MAVLVLPVVLTTLVAVVTVLGLRRGSSRSTEALVLAALGAQVGLVATSWLVIALLPTERIGERTCPVIEGGGFAGLLALTLACAALGGVALGVAAHRSWALVAIGALALPYVVAIPVEIVKLCGLFS